MFVHEVLVPYGGLLQLGSCQLAQGFFLVPEPGIFTLDIPGLILQNLDTEGAKLILNTLLIGVFHFLTCYEVTFVKSKFTKITTNFSFH